MPADGKYLAVFFIQTALGFEPRGYSKEQLGKLITEAPINYNYLDTKFLYHLEKKGIPAQSKLPFAASWLAILEKVRRENPHAASWLSTLLYAEWGFMYWFSHTSNLGISKELIAKSRVRSAIKKKYPGNEIKSVGTSQNDLNIKWWLDNLVLQLRALWDKIPYAIAESNDPQIKLKGSRHNKRVRELTKNKTLLKLWPGGEIVFDRIVNELENIEYIKKHRDAELHKHVKAYAEVFGLYERHESLITVWNQLGNELMRCREALMATIGLILRS